MKLRWTAKARSDLERLHAFLAPVNARAAAQVMEMLMLAPERLLKQPRLGVRLEIYELQEVRRLLVGDYEIRYELVGDTIHVVRLWHSREDR
jgi:plasmid stabilization system protein ParE